MTSVKNTIILNKPDLFVPSVTRDQAQNAHELVTTGEEVSDTNIASSASFRYDPPGVGLRSSQQLDVDWSRFENHTFFSSAEVNVNVAFERIINEFPFDGTKKEIERFFDKLTGFEKWVYDNFPKNKGYLFFSGTVGVGTGGTVIEIEDFAGSQMTTLAKSPTGKSILDPRGAPFTMEMQLLLAAEANDREIIAQKISGSDQGITLAVSEDTAGTNGELYFSVSSGSHILNASASVPKGQWNHIAATFDPRPGQNDLKIYVNEELAGQSEIKKSFDSIVFTNSRFTIGSGSSFVTASGGALFDQQQTLTGAIDEFRVFHSVRTPVQQQCFGTKAIFPTSDLKLYLKFNEPTGSIDVPTTEKINRVVLDSSGNSLHGFILEGGFDFSLRDSSSLASPMVNEKLELSPVLFPQYVGVQDLNSVLLISATNYDTNNPNLITKLVPKHYFEEGQGAQGLDSVGGEIGTTITSGSSFPGDVTLGSGQLLATVLYTWAKSFDDVKIMVDTLNRVLTVGYDSTNTTPDQFLPLVAEYFGFKLPGFFSNAGVTQFIDAENVDHDISTNTVSLRFVQNQILRRILTSLRDIISSKGTIHGIKAFFRAMGIDPDNSVRIREFGGPTRSSLVGLRERKTEVSTILNMSASAALIQSPFMTASRIAPKESFPPAAGTFVPATLLVPTLGGGTTQREVQISNDPADGLLTSGSWTYEAVYRFPLAQAVPNASQSLVRLLATGTLATAPMAIANVIATSGSDVTGNRVRLWLRSGADPARNDALLEMSVSGANVFDGDRWHVSFGRVRNDELGLSNSSSFFLRVEKNEPGGVHCLSQTSSFFISSQSNPLGEYSDVFTELNPAFNASGTFLAVGEQTLGIGGQTFLGDPTPVPNAEARGTFFDGKVSHMRWWTKALTHAEMSEHARNFRSVGVSDSRVNFNFVDNLSGSFERLRMDITTDQPDEDRSANATGGLRLFDFSSNAFHWTGTGFASGTKPIEVETYSIDALSTVIDEASTSEKVRIRSFKEFDNVLKNPLSRVGPVYEIPRSEMPQDDVRLAIDFSVADALNRDIISILAALDEFDDALGRPETMFSQDYPRLMELRDVYFNRLSDRVNVRAFQDFYKWIDTSVGTFIEQLIPRKTRFLGMNFVIENHMLERPRLEYKHSDTYMGENIRLDRSVILLRQIVGSLKKY